MKILIDIGHNAHVHFFKNFIGNMTAKGHEFIITAKDRRFLFQLLDEYNISYYNKGKRATSLIKKLFYLLKDDKYILNLAKNQHPDMFLGFGSPCIAHVSLVTKKPSIYFYDTEHSFFFRQTYLPFTKTFITPASYYANHGRKQYRFDGYKELAYLHPKRYTPDKDIKQKLGLKNGSKYVILRFIDKNAFHDLFYKGFNDNEKIQLITTLEKYAKVFISNESPLPEKYWKYRIPLPPHKIHDVLAGAELFLGEGATMAAEAALVGTPSIYNYLQFGYLKSLQAEGLLNYTPNIKNTIQLAKAILKDDNAKQKQQQKAKKVIDECIDLTAFMEWLVENYPNSLEILRKDPSYQYKFK